MKFLLLLFINFFFLSKFISSNKLYYSLLYKFTENEVSYMLDIKNTLGNIPEASSEEFKTSKEIEKNLKILNIKYTNKWANGNGIVAEIGTGNSPSVAIITSIDAPVIPMQSNYPFSEKFNKTSHFSGNDYNMAIVLGIAKLFKSKENLINGTVKLIFTPKHETNEGVKLMIEEGLLTKYPPINLIFGTQIDTEYEPGTFVSSKNNFLPYKQDFSLSINGISGHVVQQIDSVDTISPLTSLLSSFSSFITHETHFFPENIASITTGQITSNNFATNSIGNNVNLIGTYRALNFDVFNKIKNRIKEIIKYTALSYKCTYTYNEPSQYIPALKNDNHLLSFLEEVNKFNLKNIITNTTHLTSSDFSYIYNEIPGLFFVTGAGGKNYPTMYSPYFKANDNSLLEGASMLAYITLKGLIDIQNNINIEIKDEL